MKQAFDKFCLIYKLSKRETEIFQLLILGEDTQANYIASEIGISPNTVRIHIKNINTKVRASSKSQAMQKFFRLYVES